MKRGKEKKKKTPLHVFHPPCYSHLLPSSFHLSKKIFSAPFFPPGHHESPFYPSSIRQFCTKASNGNNSLYRRVSNEMAPIVPLQLGPKLLQPLGQIMCVYWFDSQVMGMRSVHIGSAIVAGGWLPSGSWHWNKEAFFPPFTRLVSWQIHWFSTQ